MPAPRVKQANSVPLTDAAHLLQVGRNRLFALLRSRGILGAQNLPHHKYVSDGLLGVAIKMHQLPGHGFARWYAQTIITPDGLAWLADILEQNEATHSAPAIRCRNRRTNNTRSEGGGAAKRARTPARTDCAARRKCLALAKTLADQGAGNDPGAKRWRSK